VTPSPDPEAPPRTAIALSGRVVTHGPFLFRNGQKFFAKGATYGPFHPNAAGEFFPEPEGARRDLALARSLSINTLRLYYPPPRWFADLCEENGIALLVGIPWSEHIAGFGERRFERRVIARVKEAVASLRGHKAILGHLVGNEIPTTNVRWSGPAVVERFLGDLYAAAKDTDPGALISYANYPSTEYLSLEAFDFYTLNLYLHDRKAFRDYMARMRNLAGHKPFLLGEFGIDTIREGEKEQAHILSQSLEEACWSGVAGAFVFSFTDEWFRGGNEVTDWAFGLVDRDRKPKLSAEAVRAIYERAPAIAPWRPAPEESRLPGGRMPKVSVVVATYNGAPTLEETLRSLAKLRYADHEVIVIDDGSKDRSAEIAEPFTKGERPMRLIRQENRGLSAARNRGIEAATGDVVAFIDSDAAADEHWLDHLVTALLRGGKTCAGVGGPNLPPPGDGRVAAAVAASPGGPTHVLLDDTTAEHIPGCNMAFWKSALDEIGGFDARHTSAGDDVDVCWRLQDRGLKLAYAPSAIVWHHRRNAAGAYLRQQKGYGAAESVLAVMHPGRFNSMGGALWRGRIYSSGGGEGDSALVSQRRIHYGIFGKGLFQTIYQPGSPLIFELAATPEWTITGALALAGGLLWPSIPAAIFGAALVLSTAAVALRLAVKARLEPRYDGLITRALIFALSAAQPWVRRWGQLKSAHGLRRRAAAGEERCLLQDRDVDATSAVTRTFWTEAGSDRDPFLNELERTLATDGLPVHRGSGFEPFDLEIGGDRGARVLISTVMEYHGGPQRLLRLRSEPRLTHGALAAIIAALGLSAGALAVSAVTASIGVFVTALLAVHFRRRAVWLRRAVMARAAEVARGQKFTTVQVKRRTGWKHLLPIPLRRMLP